MIFFISYCKLNNDDIYNIPPIKDNILDCNYLKIKNNEKNNKLKKCSLTNNKYLIKTFPSIKYILKTIIDKKLIINAGKIQQNIDKNQTEINNRISDKTSDNMTNELKHTLNDSYKLILSETVNDFASYLTENDINTKQHDVKNLTNAYVNILKELKERNAEYALIKKYNICRENPIKKFCRVKNVLSCLKLCNNFDECRFVSHNNKNKTCKIYNKCNLERNYKYNTYIKRSLLRNEGYNIYNRFLLSRNPPIPNRPFYIDIILVIISICFIISVTSIGARFIIILLKFVYCFIYDDYCYYPHELLSFNDPLQKYI